MVIIARNNKSNLEIPNYIEHGWVENPYKCFKLLLVTMHEFLCPAGLIPTLQKQKEVSLL